MADRPVLDVVFEGGGARGLALNGALAALQAEGYDFRRLVGTSAGAISATLVAAGYSGEALRALSLEQNAEGKSRMTEFIRTPGGFSDAELVDSSLGSFFRDINLPFLPESLESYIDLTVMRQLMKLPLFPNLFSLIEDGGFFSARGFVDWLAEKLDADGRNMSALTLEELYARTQRDLSVVVSNTTRESMLVLNHRTAPRCPVLYAVRMSMSIPFLWPEVIWQADWGRYCGQDLTGDAMVDGGVVSNFALRLLVSDEDWVEAIMGGPPDPRQQILGLSLDSNRPVPSAPPPAGLASHLSASKTQSKLLGRLERLLNTMMVGNDSIEIQTHPRLVCHLPVQGYGVAEFNMSPARIAALLDAGQGAVRAWLQRHERPCTIAHARTDLAHL